jgi:hypothetical protein
LFWYSTQCNLSACKNALRLSISISTPIVATAHTANPTSITSGDFVAADAIKTRSKNTALSCECASDSAHRRPRLALRLGQPRLEVVEIDGRLRRRHRARSDPRVFERRREEAQPTKHLVASLHSRRVRALGERFRVIQISKLHETDVA